MGNLKNRPDCLMLLFAFRRCLVRVFHLSSELQQSWLNLFEAIWWWLLVARPGSNDRHFNLEGTAYSVEGDVALRLGERKCDMEGDCEIELEMEELLKVVECH